MVGDSLSRDDLIELSKLCKLPFDLVELTENLPTHQTVDATELPHIDDVSGTVALREISNVENTNAICSRQKLTFGAEGLTIIFGYNGSGKSGYGRILKRACRSREW